MSARRTEVVHGTLTKRVGPADTHVVTLRTRRARRRSAHPAWISRVRARAKDNRGVAVLEAAFVTPVFFTLIFGIVEMGLTMNDYLATANTVRAGSRVASASGDDVYADYGIIQAVDRESSALPRSSITRIVVYKATGLGQLPTATCQAGTAVTGVCNVYTAAAFDAAKSSFGCVASENLDKYWCPTTRKVTLTGTGPDYVGVWMTVRHQTLTRMFVTVQTLTDQSVIQLEPRHKQ